MYRFCRRFRRHLQQIIAIHFYDDLMARLKVTRHAGVIDVKFRNQRLQAHIRGFA